MENVNKQLLDAAKALVSALNDAMPHMNTGHDGVGPDCTKQFQALIDGSQAIAAAEQAQQAEPVAYPPYSVFSNSDGDSWEEHPASDCFVHGKKLGEEFELLAGWQAERVTFRVTKVPDDENDDYEVEEVNPAPVAIKKPVRVLVNALEKLARLGAGDRYGNSDGNLIAQQALATYRHYAAQPPAVAVAVTDGWRDAATSALRFIEANAGHDPLCNVFDLDDDGRHKGCTCGMEDAVKKLRAMLDAAQKGGA